MLLDPGLGAAVGIARTVVAAAVWVRHGQPDFYFRGWGAVELGLILWAAAGAAVGIPFAAVVTAGERWLGRRVRALPASVSVVVAVVAMTWAVVEWEFARVALGPVLVLDGLAVLVAGAFMLAWSRSSNSNPAPAVWPPVTVDRPNTVPHLTPPAAL
ncbi:hypothetical protein R5W23_001548 [Gemmata sp. JC673]|uniref:Uncharacterized protein n=1 Tax=Gemmata algarum TaxID=2975278 RepID=A0ABU5EYE0_9BACT|nr:hypothetical protein [Gemmata algarum]MDY3560316.1 hypothetical protein [Gemmata algarum]